MTREGSIFRSPRRLTGNIAAQHVMNGGVIHQDFEVRYTVESFAAKGRQDAVFIGFVREGHWMIIQIGCKEKYCLAKPIKITLILLALLRLVCVEFRPGILHFVASII